ncbi:MAG: hypothetical protein LIP08_02945 [Bacteroides sp.]|nr:hypothetical protein [Bacteroides sp.]
MILDLFKYYASFPAIEGVKSIFSNGRSTNPLYASLQKEIEQLPTHSRIPEINHYVFGQSYDAVKSRIDTLDGIYLFLEFGELSSGRDNKNSIQDTFRIAVTIAGKTTNTTDLVEQALLTDHTLRLIHQLRVLQFSDQAQHPWLKEISNRHTIEPFVYKEFSSLGWTILYNREGTDILGLKDDLRKLK